MNDCGNTVIIKGKAENIALYLSCIPKVGGKYDRAAISAVPLTEFTTDAEYGVYFDEHVDIETNTHDVKDLYFMSWRFRAFELRLVSPERLEMLFASYSSRGYIGGLDIPGFKRLNILHKWFEPMNNYSGFRHWYNGEVVAEGGWSYHEDDPYQGFSPLLAYCDPDECHDCQSEEARAARREGRDRAMFANEDEFVEYQDLPEIDRLQALKTKTAKISEAKKI